MGFVSGFNVGAYDNSTPQIQGSDLAALDSVDAVADIARQLNPLLRGWIEYYGRFTQAALGPILRYVNQTIEAWMMRKFKRNRNPTKSVLQAALAFRKEKR
jgi:hypothetical protein